jgi:hypothetical protein
LAFRAAFEKLGQHIADRRPVAVIARDGHQVLGWDRPEWIEVDCAPVRADRFTIARLAGKRVAEPVPGLNVTRIKREGFAQGRFGQR